jgi:ABC-type sugar transport system, ATPase component
MSENLVEFNNISKFFGSVIALKDVTMHIKKGQIMCLLGDNGAGKSTLIKTLSGVHKPTHGEIIVEGKKTVFDSPKRCFRPWNSNNVPGSCFSIFDECD